ncbi:MAG: efflux RND transporter periplasmic adaptor subunit [Gammaproteobacteria bacterium]|nr:efflux RND transporter periplasmic adaptor subunit [Gammaproteobacteria bacterium]MBU0787889.1 efflux RND transporter periplasmic adaptor subunit [Gammaproteobacteria bacterium]MBU0816993.1 efflux RND transporter periplasmic adaptor subunit [Gammaproteobacteria bacterium]MBU1787157.1 efflux RND transporter periplasmic adaptor subunit [Gammaproteobacteria bacterium]
MKRWLKWAVIALVVAVVAITVLRTLKERKQQKDALTEQTAQRTQNVIELAATDVVRAQARELMQGLPISGALKAVNSALIKARVAGELQDLSVREGDVVKAGQVIARIDPNEYQSRVRQSQEQADAAKAQIDIAQRQYDNNAALVKQGFISTTALDTSSSNLLAAKANYQAALAAVDVAKKSLQDTILRSPISGLVSQRLAQPGERMAIDARVIEVVDLSRIELEATLSVADSQAVRVGQRATLQVEGVGKALGARVVRINPSVLAGSRSVLAYLSLDEPAGMRQGMFAQGTLGTGVSAGLAIPLSAVRTDKPEPYVQLVENQKVRHQPVELGTRGQADNETMVIIKGLKEDAVVIRGGVGTLRAGTDVRFTQPAKLTAPAMPLADAANTGR